MIDDVTVLILAGGAGRRMGGNDKGWLEIGGTPLIALLYRRLAAQCPNILISANRNIEKYATFGAPVVTDTEFRDAGPLAGVYNSLHKCVTPWLITIAVDTPGIPDDYVARFRRQIDHQHLLFVAHDGTRAHPTCAMLATSLRTSLEDFLRAGRRRVTEWQQQHTLLSVNFSDAPRACYNINTPEDLAAMNSGDNS